MWASGGPPAREHNDEDDGDTTDADEIIERVRSSGGTVLRLARLRLTEIPPKVFTMI